MFHAPDYLIVPLSDRVPQIANGMPRETVDYILKMNRCLRDYTAQVANINFAAARDEADLTQRFTAERSARYISHVAWYNSDIMMKCPVAQMREAAMYKTEHNQYVADFVRKKNAIILKAVEDRAVAQQTCMNQTVECVEAYYSHVAKARFDRKYQNKIDKAKRIEQRAARLQAMKDAPPFHDRPRKARKWELRMAMDLAGRPDHPFAQYDEGDLYDLIWEVYGPTQTELSFDPDVDSDCSESVTVSVELYF